MQISCIRLFFAVLASSVAVLFVSLFSEYSALAHKYAHPDTVVIYSALNELLRKWSAYAVVIPAVALLVGAAVIKWKSNRLAALEVVIQLCWLFALAWPLFAILSWELERIPHINLRGIHW